MTSFTCPFRVHDKPYVELKDSDGRSDHIVAEEVGSLHSSFYLSSCNGHQLCIELNLNWLLLNTVLFLLNKQHT